MYSFGIDFGTTNVSASYMEEGRDYPEVILDEATGEPFPAVVVYKDGKFLVGKEAKDIYISESRENPERTFRSIKRELNKKMVFDLGDCVLTPIDVASKILSFLKKEMEKKGIGPVESATFSVPIYFDGTYRRSLREVARKAGIEVEKFIHEPTAAILRYEITPEKFPQHIIVYDWGGGSLDISLVKVYGDSIEELGVESYLRGGDDFDKAILNYAKDQFCWENGIEIKELPPGVLNRSLHMCEDVKKSLSEKIEEKLMIPNFYKEKDLNLSIDRKTFEKLIREDVETAVSKIYSLIERCRLLPSQIDKVLLSGGTCQIPYIIQRLQDEFGGRVEKINPSTCIADGNAIASFRKGDIIPHLASDIGVVLCDDTFFPVFEKGTPLKRETAYCSKVECFYVTDVSFGEAIVILAERTSSEDQLNRIGVLKIPIETRLKEGDETVKVEFEIDENYILKIRGKGEHKLEEKELELTNIRFGVKWVR